MKETFYDWGGLNAWLFKLINGLYIPGAEKKWLFITSFGAHENFKYYIAIISLFLLIEMISRKLQKKPIDRKYFNEAGALIITLVMGYMAYGFIVGIMKSLFYLPRPFMVPDIRAHMHYAGPYPAQADYFASFPSGHTATMGFLASALWYKFNNRYMHFITVALVVLVGWSRIAVGMHFPADVLGGALIGALIAYFIRQYVYHMMRVPLPQSALLIKLRLPNAPVPTPPRSASQGAPKK